MYGSLRSQDRNSHLHLLCVDEETYEVMMETNLPLTNRYEPQFFTPLNVGNEIPITLYKLDVLKEQEDWEVLEKNNKSEPGGITPFHYSLASYFLYYLIFQKELANCLYMDSDLLFFHPLDDLQDALSNYSVGLGTHKHNNREAAVGFYNVGVVYFKNDEGGRKCLEFWKNCAIDPSNKWFKTHGQCGDQKYLELFEKTIDKKDICIIDKYVGHTAPWNMSLSILYTVENKIWVKWETFNVFPEINYLEQPLLFHHFAHFRILPNGYKVDWGGEWTSQKWFDGMRKHIHNMYYEKMIESMKKYNLEYKL